MGGKEHKKKIYFYFKIYLSSFNLIALRRKLINSGKRSAYTIPDSISIKNICLCTQGSKNRRNYYNKIDY